MTCQAKTYSDGSWRCEECSIAGDKDEDVEDFCKRREADDAEKDDKTSAR